MPATPSRRDPRRDLPRRAGDGPSGVPHGRRRAGSRHRASGSRRALPGEGGREPVMTIDLAILTAATFDCLVAAQHAWLASPANDSSPGAPNARRHHHPRAPAAIPATSTPPEPFLTHSGPRSKDRSSRRTSAKCSASRERHQRVACAACGRSRRGDLPSGFCWSACYADSVRACRYDPTAGSPRARTYSGQRR